MIYQNAIVFNELSISSIKLEEKDRILSYFYDLCLYLIKISGKNLTKPDRYNLNKIFFYENFDKQLFTSFEKYDDVERRRLKKLFDGFDIPAVPEYRFEDTECRGLGYAHTNNLLGISLKTSKKWDTSALQIDKLDIDSSLKIRNSPVVVRNIASIDNAFEIMEEFADKFYENCCSETMYFKVNPKDKKDDNFTHNLLPLKDISNLYLEYKRFYDPDRKVSNVTETKKTAKVVAEINGWEICNSSGRVIYRHKQIKYYLSNDTKKGDFEIHDSQGKHLGAISLDCKKQEELVENRKITPC